MALLQSEIAQLQFELGWTNLTTGAVPYIGTVATFQQVVEPYLNAGLITTSSTAVVAPTTPTLTAITLAATTGTNRQGTAVSVHVGDSLVIDTDYQQEIAHVQSITGSIVSVQLRLAHTGTYSVTVQGGEEMVRFFLRRCWSIRERIANSDSRAGIKKVDEIEFFEAKGGGSTVFKELIERQTYWRQELFRVLFGQGDRSLTGNDTGGGGGAIALY
jgi:hypothetical protein